MIYIIRHGQTDWNIRNKVMGRYNEPLNDNGIKQANKLKDMLESTNINLIICSPLLRAKQTAEIINQAKNNEIIYDDRIIERDFGEFEGLQINEFDNNGYWDYYQNKVYKEAENIQLFFKRVYDFLNDIIKKYNDKNVLVITHAGVSIAIDCFFSNEIPKGSLVKDSLVLKNCEIKSYGKD